MESVERAVGGSALLVLASVRGLSSEADEVRAHFERFTPEAMALPVGPRELQEIEEALKEKGLMPGAPGNRPVGHETRLGPSGVADKRLERSEDDSDFDDFGLFVSTSDMVFLRHLSRWGAVEMPPPAYQEAARLAHERKVPLEGVDFDDDAYTTVFLEHVSTFSLIRQGRRLRKLSKRKFKAQNPAAFAREWDALVTRVKGYRAVEAAREEKVASGLLEALKAKKRLLAVVEAERLGGVLGALDRMAQAQHQVPPATGGVPEGAA